MNTVYLEGVAVGEKYSPYFIAEIGGNFKTEAELIKLIDDAVEAGANAVKFQTLDAETITTKNNFFFFNGAKPTSQYESFKKSQTPKELQQLAFRYAKEKEITVFTAPSHIKDVEFMEKILECGIYKIGSDLACHIPLLREVARLQKPIILSTGMTTLNEVRRSVEAILNEGNEQLILLHCVSNYPCNPEEVNLRAMETLRSTFNLPVGYSDHTLGIEISLAAVALGATVIERHFTFDKMAEGPDHILSSTKEEFQNLIKASKNIFNSLGTGVKQPTPNELRYRLFNRVGINVIKDVTSGEILTEQHIDVRRPAKGIPPHDWQKVLGKRIKHSLKEGTSLQWRDLEN